MKRFPFFLLCCMLAGVAFPAWAASPTSIELRLSAQEGELRALNGRIEEIGFALRKIDSALQRLQSDVAARLGEVEKKVDTLAARPRGATEGSLGTLPVRNGRGSGGTSAPSAPSLPLATSDYGMTPKEQYERAFNFLREADYGEAEKAFRAFIERNPKDNLLDNAKYWYAETLYVRTRFEEAAVAFADAYQQNPKGVKAPDSLLKLGMSLAALKKKADACVTFNELKHKYPNASPTIKTRAREERAKLKCPN